MKQASRRKTVSIAGSQSLSLHSHCQESHILCTVGLRDGTVIHGQAYNQNKHVFSISLLIFKHIYTNKIATTFFCRNNIFQLWIKMSYFQMLILMMESSHYFIFIYKYMLSCKMQSRPVCTNNQKNQTLGIPHSKRSAFICLQITGSVHYQVCNALTPGFLPGVN